MKIIFEGFSRMNSQVECRSQVVCARTRRHTRVKPSVDSYESIQGRPFFCQVSMIILGSSPVNMAIFNGQSHIFTFTLTRAFIAKLPGWPVLVPDVLPL